MAGPVPGTFPVPVPQNGVYQANLNSISSTTGPPFRDQTVWCHSSHRKLCARLCLSGSCASPQTDHCLKQQRQYVGISDTHWLSESPSMQSGRFVVTYGRSDILTTMTSRVLTSYSLIHSSSVRVWLAHCKIPAHTFSPPSLLKTITSSLVECTTVTTV